MSYINDYFSIGSYIESVEFPKGRFRTLCVDDCVKEIGAGARIMCGNKAVIFKLICRGEYKMLKCYLNLQPRSARIIAYINSQPRSKHVRKIEWLEKEMFVYNSLGEGSYRDVLVADWVEGKTLDYHIRLASITQDKAELMRLADQFKELSVWLLDQSWAHGDIKPENIIVCDEHLVLIDYGAIYTPDFEGESTQDIGTPAFQHPERNSSFYNKHLDDYSIALITTLLYGLSIKPELYNQRLRDDMCLLSPVEILSKRSEAYIRIKELFVQYGLYAQLRIADTLVSPTPIIESLPELLAQIGSVGCEHHNLSLMEQRGKWGYANSEGQCVIAPIYDTAQEFSEGLAAVWLHGVWQYIDTRGQLYMDCREMRTIKNFKEGLAAVAIGDKWGYIDKNGRTVIEPKFEMASSMNNGVAQVKYNGKYGYISKNGAWLVEPNLEYALREDGNNNFEEKR